MRARARKLSLKSISPRIARCDRTDLLANPEAHRQLVHHFHIDQGGIHVESNQTPVAPKNVVFVHAEVEIQRPRRFHQIGLENAGVFQLATHAYLHTDLTLIRILIELYRSRQAPDVLDVQPVPVGQGTHGMQLRAHTTPAQQRDHVAGPVRSLHPLPVSIGIDRGEAYSRSDGARLLQHLLLKAL